MHLETADYAPDAATWRTARNIRVICDHSGLFPPLHANMKYLSALVVGAKIETKTQLLWPSNMIAFCSTKT